MTEDKTPINPVPRRPCKAPLPEVHGCQRAMCTSNQQGEVVMREVRYFTCVPFAGKSESEVHKLKLSKGVSETNGAWCTTLAFGKFHFAINLLLVSFPLLEHVEFVISNDSTLFFKFLCSCISSTIRTRGFNFHWSPPVSLSGCLWEHTA